MWEQNHVADGLRIGQQHHQAVKADAAAAGGGQAVFHCADVVGVVVHGFVVAGVFLRHLCSETGGLVFGVVQLRVAVGQLATDDEQLEAVGQAGLGVGRTRQRGDFDGIIDDEGRIPQFAFGAAFKQSQLQAADAGRRRQAFAVFDDFLFQPCFVGKLFVGVVRIVFFDGFENGQTFEGAGQVDFFTVAADFRRAAHRFGTSADDAFGHLHHAFVGAEGFIEFHHGEFGIMAGRHAFVTKAAVDFEHALQTAYDQAFQIQFGRDTQVKRHIQRIVVGNERLGRRTTRNRVHHRSFYLQITFADHVVAHGLDDFAAFDKGVARFGIDD